MNLARLHHLYAAEGPFVSLHLDVSRESEDAAHRIDTRWAEARSQLANAGADAALLDRIEESALRPTGVGGAARWSLVAAGDSVLLDDVRAGAGAWEETVTTGPLPDVSGWLSQVEGDVPFVLVVADREGADIDVYRALSLRDPQHHEVHGETLHISKVPSAEWHDVQQHTEEVWHRNARNVAASVRTAAKEHRPRAVVLAGDVRARAEVHHALDEEGRLPVLEVEAGGRGEGSSRDALWTAVVEAVGALQEQEHQQVLDSLDERSGQGRAVARGLRDVLGAMVRGQVDRLVLDLAGAHTQTISPGDYPGLQLPAAALDGHRLPGDQVLVAAGAATDAELTVLPAAQVGGDGVAALLRWDS